MAYFDCRNVITTGNSTQWPKDDQPEVLLVGRSNTGKSSLINTLTNRKNLAYVGKTPGKTRLLNFYEMTSGFRLVDSISVIFYVNLYSLIAFCSNSLALLVVFVLIFFLLYAV